MRLLAALALFFTSWTLMASHDYGGHITWECIGNNQYVFTVAAYRDCSPMTASLWPYYDIHGPNGLVIRANQDTLWDATMACNAPGGSGCGSSSGPGVCQLGLYVSNPVTLVGTPPAAGWKFYIDMCCRSSSTVNMSGTGNSYTYQSFMYADPSGCNSSPLFTTFDRQPLARGNRTLGNLAYSTNLDDSLHYELIKPDSMAFASGFTGVAPFPDQGNNSANGPISINHSNGLITMDVKTGAAGNYAYAVMVEQWRNGVLISKVKDELVTGADFTWTGNGAPSVSIDTSSSNIQRAGYVYTAFVNVGDTLDLEIRAHDSTNGGQFQQLNFFPAGRALNGFWGPANFQMGSSSTGSQSGFTHNATLTPVSPQTGFTGVKTNNINFNWIIGKEHQNGRDARHYFSFRFSDDHCPYVGATTIILEVVITGVATISQDTVHACTDSIMLNGATSSGQYSWTPLTGISNPSIATPLVSPSQPQYYYLKDPAHPTFVDSVYVYPKRAFKLTHGLGVMTLVDSNNVSSYEWYYNGIPLSHPYKTLSPSAIGQYWVNGYVPGCMFTTDTITYLGGGSYAFVAMGNGGYYGTVAPVYGSLGATFTLDDSINLTNVLLPGITNTKKSSSYVFNLRLYDENQNVLFNLDTTLIPPFENFLDIKVSEHLEAGKEYTLAVGGGASYGFKVYENVTYPYGPYSSGLNVLGAYEGIFKGFPAQPSPQLIPFALKSDQYGVGLSETPASLLRIYPNPATQSFTIEGLNGICEIQIVDVNGKVVYSQTTNEDSLIIERGNMSSGIYLVKVSGSNETVIQKVILQ